MTENNFYWYKKYKEVLNENEQLKKEVIELKEAMKRLMIDMMGGR